MADAPTPVDVPIEDALEQQSGAGGSDGDAAAGRPGGEFLPVADDVPEADALEQATAALGEDADRAGVMTVATAVLPEVNEADAAEQLLEVDLDDDYDR